jgi:hypothetical protein
MRTFLLTSVLALAAAGPALADQCAINSSPVTARAVALVKKGATVLEYCEPCGDKAPGAPYTVTTVDVRGGEVYINGKGIDLAYLYVQTQPDELENVGIATQCGAARVSSRISNGRPIGPPRGPRPSMPPPPPRVTGVDDFAGTWNVRITTQYSSCPKVAPTGSEQVRWVTSNTGLDLALHLPSGTRLAGTIDAKGGFQRSTLRSVLRPSAVALQLSQFSKDSFGGTLIRAEALPGSPRDPVCVIHQNISARREP